MFILRRITKDNIEINTLLGGSYNITYKERNEKEFKDNMFFLFGIQKDDDIYAFITYNSGKDFLPLYINSKYFVMCSDGKTFDNVSLK